MKFNLMIAAGVLAVLTMPLTAQAQGVIRGAEEGAAAGNRAAGPVGGAVGGVVGGVEGGIVGGVNRERILPSPPTIILSPALPIRRSVPQSSVSF